ncbi:hypothetical protein ROBYS_42550 [Roseobacter sp. OBYS 0001]|nr:hypothetical protein ROBYS_42550 [Roseobacter sp. OBYS 0001]
MWSSWAERKRARSHLVRLTLKPRIIIDRLIPFSARGSHPPRGLLHHMPGLMGQMLILSGCEVDVATLRVGMSPQLCWLGRIAVNPDPF